MGETNYENIKKRRKNTSYWGEKNRSSKLVVQVTLQ